MSGTDGQPHNPPATIAKQIHCHIDCLSLNVTYGIVGDLLFVVQEAI